MTRILGAISLAEFLLAATLFTAGVARADDPYCVTLQADPSVLTLQHMVTALVSQGRSPFTALLMISSAVVDNCVEYAPVLDAYMREFTGDWRVQDQMGGKVA